MVYSLIPLDFEEKSTQISADWKTKAKIYVSADSSIVYSKLLKMQNITINASMIFIISNFYTIYFNRIYNKTTKEILTTIFKSSKLILIWMLF